MRGCTTLDHIYPNSNPGVGCYCGARTWGPQRPRAKRVAVGSAVVVFGEPRVVTEKLRGEDVYRVDAPVRGRALFDRDELEAQ